MAVKSDNKIIKLGEYSKSYYPTDDDYTEAFYWMRTVQRASEWMVFGTFKNHIR